MPIVFVHGVAVRDPDDPQYAAAQRLTRGADWTVVEAALREHVAPAVRPSAPERVALIRVYWGDLGPIASHLTWSLGMLFLLPATFALGG